MEEILITIVIEIRINLLHMFRQYKLQFLLPPLLLEEEPKHCLQAKGFSPVWISLCTFKLWLRVNLLEHNVQTNLLSPVCVLMWILRFPLVLVLNVHSVHACDFSCYGRSYEYSEYFYGCIYNHIQCRNISFHLYEFICGFSCW